MSVQGSSPRRHHRRVRFGKARRHRGDASLSTNKSVSNPQHTTHYLEEQLTWALEVLKEAEHISTHMRGTLLEFTMGDACTTPNDRARHAICKLDQVRELADGSPAMIEKIRMVESAYRRLALFQGVYHDLLSLTEGCTSDGDVSPGSIHRSLRFSVGCAHFVTDSSVPFGEYVVLDVNGMGVESLSGKVVREAVERGIPGSGRLDVDRALLSESVKPFVSSRSRVLPFFEERCGVGGGFAFLDAIFLEHDQAVFHPMADGLLLPPGVEECEQENDTGPAFAVARQALPMGGATMESIVDQVMGWEETRRFLYETVTGRMLADVAFAQAVTVETRTNRLRSMVLMNTCTELIQDLNTWWSAGADGFRIHGTSRLGLGGVVSDPSTGSTDRVLVELNRIPQGRTLMLGAPSGPKMLGNFIRKSKVLSLDVGSERDTYLAFQCKLERELFKDVPSHYSRLAVMMVAAHQVFRSEPGTLPPFDRAHIEGAWGDLGNNAIMVEKMLATVIVGTFGNLFLPERPEREEPISLGKLAKCFHRVHPQIFESSVSELVGAETNLVRGLGLLSDLSNRIEVFPHGDGTNKVFGVAQRVVA